MMSPVPGRAPRSAATKQRYRPGNGGVSARDGEGSSTVPYYEDHLAMPQGGDGLGGVVNGHTGHADGGNDLKHAEQPTEDVRPGIDEVTTLVEHPAPWR